MWVPAGCADAEHRRPTRHRHRAEVADEGRAGQAGDQPDHLPEYDDDGRDESDTAGERVTGRRRDGEAHVVLGDNDALRLSSRRAPSVTRTGRRTTNGASLASAGCRRQSRSLSVTGPVSRAGSGPAGTPDRTHCRH
ncbi:hypothetical protein GCM10022379_13720 [Micromonospora maritima]